MAIKDRELAVGTLLKGSYKKVEYECRVEADDKGKLAFLFADGRRFNSPSSAASAVMEGKAVNGWLFWSVAGKEEVRESQKAKKKLFYRLPNQRGVAEAKVRWFCNGCRKSFVVDANEKPEACPEGHAA